VRDRKTQSSREERIKQTDRRIMGAYLSQPVKEKESSDGGNVKVKFGTSAMQGWRTSMEDSHCAVPDLDENTSFFAVFDGHGGKEVALYAGRYLPQILKDTNAYKEENDLKQALVESFMKIDEVMKDKTNAQELAELSGRRRFREEEEDADEKMSAGGSTNVNEAIRRALKERLLAEGTPSEEVDLIIPSLTNDDDEEEEEEVNKKNGERKEGGEIGKDSSKNTAANEQPVASTSSAGGGKKKFVPLSEEELSEWEGPVAGAAAVSVALRNGEIICANAGDSRAVLCRDGKAIDMSRDHKPTDEDECERIVKAGGFVADGRVNGSLALSRAIGDFEYKRNNVPDDLPPELYCVTANPEVKTFKYEQDQDEFIIIACDGVWDVMTSQECVDFVRERLCYSSTKDGVVPPEHLSKITEELCDACCATDTRGSGLGCDNISAVIVQFLDSKKYKETTEKYKNNTSSVEGKGTNQALDDDAKEATAAAAVGNTN
jgi:serine/threonine protein phosphatase PrpC